MCGISAHASRWQPVCLRVLSAQDLGVWKAQEEPMAAASTSAGTAWTGGASCGCRPARSCPGRRLRHCACPRPHLSSPCASAQTAVGPCAGTGCLYPAAWPGPAPAAVGGAGGPGLLGRDRPQAGAGLWGGVGGWSFPGGHQAPGAARDPCSLCCFSVAFLCPQAGPGLVAVPHTAVSGAGRRDAWEELALKGQGTGGQGYRKAVGVRGPRAGLRLGTSSRVLRPPPRPGLIWVGPTGALPRKPIRVRQ